MSTRGGLQSRMIREQIRGQRLRNSMMADQLSRPTAMLEDLAMLESLTGQRQRRDRELAMLPLELEQAVLRNTGLDQANQRLGLELQYLPEQLRNALLGQQEEQRLSRLRQREIEGNLEQQQYSRSRRDQEYRDQQAYRQQLLDIQRSQGIPSVLNTLSAFVDPQELALSYLRSRGLTGNPLPLPANPLGSLFQSASNPDDEIFLQRLMERLEQPTTSIQQ